jgi:hypothetical protein
MFASPRDLADQLRASDYLSLANSNSLRKFRGFLYAVL